MSLKEKLAKMRQKTVESAKEEGNAGDSRFYKVKLDDKGQHKGIIRFLPSANIEDEPEALYYLHYYVDNKTKKSLIRPDFRRVIDDRYILGEFVSWLYALDGDEEARSLAGQLRSKPNYYSNVMIIKDEQQPELEGKILIYRYGKKIHEKLEKLINPEFDDDESIIPFDPFEAPNFRLVVKTVKTQNGKYPNYDDCQFDSRLTPIVDSEEEFEEKIMPNLHDVHALHSVDEYKNWDVAKQVAELDSVLGNNKYWKVFKDEEGLDDTEVSNLEKDNAQSIADDDDDLPFDDHAKEAEPKKPSKKEVASDEADIDDVLADLGIG